MPHRLDLLVDEVGETGVNVAGGDGVDASEIPPLVGERAGEMDAACFGDVVGGLFLWVVGNVTGHGSSDDQAASLAFSEVKTNGSGAVESSIQISLNDFVPCLDSAVQDARIRCASGIGNENIDLAKVLDDIRNQLLNILVVADVALVRLRLDAVLLLELL